MRWIGDQGLSRFSVRAVPQAFLSGKTKKTQTPGVPDDFYMSRVVKSTWNDAK